MNGFGKFSIKGLIYLSALSLLVTAGSYFVSSGAFAENPAQPKICYVSLVKVFEMYQKSKDLEQSLVGKGEQKKAELEGQFKDLKKMREGLELLSDQAKEAKAREIEEKADSFKRLKTRSERELLKERNEASRLILDDIEKVIQEYAKANGYALVLDQRTILYGEEVYDATDAVLKVLNERYGAGTGKASKKQ
jgi:outer membrane protein